MRICRQGSREIFGKSKLAFDRQFGQDFLFISKVLVKKGRGVAELLCDGTNGDGLPAHAKPDRARRGKNVRPARDWANRTPAFSRLHHSMSPFTCQGSPMRAA